MNAEDYNKDVNSIEVKTDSKGNPSYSIKIYFDQNDLSYQTTQEKILDFARWFNENKESLASRG